MMSLNSEQKDNQSSLREAVEPILRVLAQLGGHFTFSDQQGEQFVIIRKQDFDTSRKAGSLNTEKQLPLSVPSKDSHYEEVAISEEDGENTNQYLDLYQIKQQEEQALAEEILHELAKEESPYDHPLPPPVRVRFEAIKGDLPPDLQE